MTAMTTRPTRRQFLKSAGASAVASFPLPALAQAGGGRVVVIGGGFAGTTFARTLKRIDPRFTVTLVEASLTYAASPFSNAVIAGLRDFKSQQFNYEKVAKDQVVVSVAPATAIDAQARVVTQSNGARLFYDRLVLAPGIDLRWDALPGYGESAAARMPHAWKAGEQTLLLRRQLEAMEDGGLVVIAAPADPYSAPAAPYERASLIAHYLKTRKPKSKLLLLDGKDSFAKQPLFQSAWRALYPGMIEWVPLSKGGKVTSADPTGMLLHTDSAKHKAAVANVIPPQRAGRIADRAGVTDPTGWCPVDPLTFESRLRPNIHVIGDAAVTDAMPKSAFAANGQAKACAAAVARLLGGSTPPDAKLIEGSYSLVAPDYAISSVSVYRPTNGQWAEVEGSGGISPLDASAATRAMEATFAEGWFTTITEEVFG
jgi:sulfide dehydrogenase [flavocytochrome c] flavoprotein subunit